MTHLHPQLIPQKFNTNQSRSPTRNNLQNINQSSPNLKRPPLQLMRQNQNIDAQNMVRIFPNKPMISPSFTTNRTRKTAPETERQNVSRLPPRGPGMKLHNQKKRPREDRISISTMGKYLSVDGKQKKSMILHQNQQVS